MTSMPNASPNPPTNHPPMQVVFLPPNAWPAPHDSAEALKQPPVNTTLHHLAQMGVSWQIVPPTRRPWNLLDRGNPFWRGLDPIRALRVLLAHRQADVIVSVFEGNALFLLLLRKLFGFKPRIVLWDASPGNPWRILQKVQAIVLPRYDGLMMLTRSQQAYLEKHYDLSGPVSCIGYNVDEQLFAPANPALPDEGYILAVGDDLSRDYPTLLATAAQCPQQQFILKTRWRPEGQAPENVTFLSGRLDDRAFVDLYAKARIVLLPLKPVASAGGITTLFEAMAMGKPVIVSQSSISDDFITHQHDGWVVPTGDAHAIAQAIETLLHDAPKREQLGRHARERIETRLSTPRLAQRIKAFLRQIITDQA